MTLTKKSLFKVAMKTWRMRIGTFLTLFVMAVALIGPFFTPKDPQSFVDLPFVKPKAGMFFGTDNLGRDVLSRFLVGGWLMVLLSIAATVIGVGLGAVLGILAGYQRGKLDEIIMRLGDVMLAFPQLLLALLFISITGPNLWVVVLLAGMGHVPRVARVMRGAAFGVAERDFIANARAMGLNTKTIVLKELLPNVSGPLAVEFGLRLTYSIGLIAGLSFLGLGVQPPRADWGVMLNDNRIAFSIQPWPVLLPVLAIAILTIGTNLVTDSLARASAGIDREARG
jgi:peptide/nickel transport system permease protein